MDYAEKLNGALLIQEFVSEEFIKQGKAIQSFEWKPIIESMAQKHNLIIYINGLPCIFKNIPRESIEDYPGKVGNETINTHVKEWAKTAANG
jgi:hypothetical protein